jgi:capsular polysaccharide biosynthesis protein
MGEQALDLKRSLRIVRRHKILVGIFAALGIFAGGSYTVLKPPLATSSAIVALPPSTRDTQTQVVIAGSDQVLLSALRSLHPAMPLQALRTRVQVRRLTSDLLSITSEGKTDAQAESIANAVAGTYVSYVNTEKNVPGKVQAHVLEAAVNATRTSLAIRLMVTGWLGGLAGVLTGGIVALAISRGDRRLRQRDEIANAIGVPVLASIPVHRPADADHWARLLKDYQPGTVHAWQLRNALRYLGAAGVISGNGSNGDGFSVAFLSLASDRGALALGPQLAAFAASIGVPTALVIGPEQGGNTTAALRVACGARPEPGQSGPLQVAVAGQADEPKRWRGARLTVVVAVLDGKQPLADGMMRTTCTVLGATSGAVTAAQLAGVAVSAAADGRNIDGILVADPDPADQTTGRVPRLARPAGRSTQSRLTGMTTEFRQ